MLGCRDCLSISILLFTARVAKRAKVMFLQACHSFCSTPGGGGGGGQHQWSTTPPPPDQVRTSTPSPPGVMGQNIYPSHPPGVMGQNIYPLPPPGSGQNIYPPPPPGIRGQNIYPLPPLLGLGHSTPPPRHYTQAGGTHPTGMHSCCLIDGWSGGMQKYSNWLKMARPKFEYFTHWRNNFYVLRINEQF